MLKHFLCAAVAVFLFLISSAQMSDSLQRVKDSTLKAIFKKDSLKVENEFREKAKLEKFKSMAIYPVLNAGLLSGIIPVKDPAEVPDPNMDYKLLFELTANNPDSLMNEPNSGLVEVARVINLHVASGISLKKIFPVIVVHGGALNAITNNLYYHQKFKTDNPNLNILNDLTKLGAKIIACGQAMALRNIPKENLWSNVKVSLTAQTVITGYQLKGYVWMVPER